MLRQGIAWGPITFVVITFLASMGLIAWGLTSSSQSAAYNTENPARTVDIQPKS